MIGRVCPDEITQTHRLARPDIILFLQGCDPLVTRREFLELKKGFPDSKIIFVSPGDDREQMELNIIKMGARGFLGVKDSLKTLVRAIKACYSGEIWGSRRSTNKIIEDLENKGSIKKDEAGGLTKQEKSVLLILTSGFKNAEIAQRLFISEKTVKTHINRIFKKIKVSNRLQAALWASKNLIGKSIEL